MNRKVFGFMVGLSLGSMMLFMQIRARQALKNEGAADTRPVLRVLTSDSWMSKHGAGTTLFPEFEKRCGCKIEVQTVASSGALLGRVELLVQSAGEGGESPELVDAVLGIDLNQWTVLKRHAWKWGEHAPKGERSVKLPALEEGFLPLDYGVFAWMWDSEQAAKRHLRAPASLADLLEPAFRRQILLEDPRSSTPGLAFERWIEALYGPRTSEKGKAFWSQFKPQVLTLAPGWDEAYGLFLKGEAPLVWSYVTSEAYHRENGKTPAERERYRALKFKESYPVQVEGVMGLDVAVRQSPMLAEKLRQFFEFLSEPAPQSVIARAQWMFPAFPKGVELPKSYALLPVQP